MLKFVIFPSIVCILALLWPELVKSNDIPSVPDLITRHGYQVETLKVVTEDDYILTIHRIPCRTKINGTCIGVVIFFHGILLSAADWLFIGPNDALPFLLADAGYDIWLCNSRGNDQSQEHLYLDSNISPSPYWDFSWHEMGVYDVPAVINYALSKTGQQNVTLVAHSQGCIEVFIAGIFYPDLKELINAVIAMAPTPNRANTRNALLRVAAPNEPAMTTIDEASGYKEVAPNKEALTKKALTFSCSGPVAQDICNLALALAIDTSPRTNTTIFSDLFNYTPSAISDKQLLHDSQCINCLCFRQFNYGPLKNMKVYGSSEPFYYDLSKVQFKVFVFHAISDTIAVPEDVERTMRELGNCVGKYLIKNEPFGHLDFYYGFDVRSLVYDTILKLLKELYQQEVNQ